MFSVKIMRGNFLKKTISGFLPFKRNIMTKKKISWWDSTPFGDGIPDFEKFRNSKLTPKGFEVVYVSPMQFYLRLAYGSLPFIWAVLTYDIYNMFVNKEQYLKGVTETKEFTLQDKYIQMGYFLVSGLALQLLSSRVVVAIFRKGNDFQTLLFGICGPWTKKYVPHGPQIMVPTSNKGIYDFKGKNVLLLSNGFRSIKDFQSVIKFDL